LHRFLWKTRESEIRSDKGLFCRKNCAFCIFAGLPIIFLSNFTFLSEQNNAFYSDFEILIDQKPQKMIWNFTRLTDARQ